MLPERVRSFLAIELPDELRRAVRRVEEALMEDFPRGVRWVPEENLHVTLKFLGPVYRDMIPEVLSEVRSAVRKCSQVTTVVKGAGLFPPDRRPRMFAVKVRNDPRLETLHQAIDGRLARMRIKKEHRRYLPHITLGRFERMVAEAASGYDFERFGESLGSLPVTHVSLFMSETGPGGPVYTRLGRVEIGVF